MRASIEKTTTLWDDQIRRVTLFKDQLSLVLLIEEQRTDAARTRETIVARTLDLAQSSLAAELAMQGKTPETNEALLQLEVEKSRLELARYRLETDAFENDQAQTAELTAHIAAIEKRIETERQGFALLLQLRTDENALANVGLMIAHAKLTEEVDARELSLLKNSQAIAHQDRVLGQLNAEKQIAEDIAAIRLDALENQASGLMRVGMQLRLLWENLGPTAQFLNSASLQNLLGPRPLAGLSPAPGPLLPMPRQHGGPVSLGRPYTVGERGPETFIPRQSGTIVPAGGGGPLFTVHAPITISLLSATRLEAQKVADSLAEAINEGIRRGTIHGNLRAA